MIFRLLIIAFLTLPVTCQGATSTWEAFDNKNCKHWTITTDYSGGDPEFERAKELLERLNREEGREVGWQLLQAWESSGEMTRFGVCAHKQSINSWLIACHPSTDFPLAGATIILDSDRKIAKCISGCEKVPFGRLYEIGYEDGPDSKYLAPAARKFEAACRKKNRGKQQGSGMGADSQK